MASGELGGKLPGRLPEVLNEWLLEAIDRSGIGLALTDAQDRFIYVNDAHARIYGRSREELLGRTWRDLVPPEVVAAHEEAVCGCLAGGEVFGCETPGFRGDGTLGYHRVMAVPLSDEGGGYAGHVCIVQDVTERKRAEEALRASEANYRAIFDAANDAIFVHDPESGDILDVNLKASEMYGCTPEEVHRINVEALSSGEPPYSQEDALRWIRKAAQGEPQLFEWLGRNKGGRRFWVEVNLKRAVIGGEERVLAVVRDIAGRKRAEEALRKRTHDLRERVKELDCLYAVSELDREGVSLAELLQRTVDLIPAAWRYPEITCARVTLRGQTFSTANFKETPWRQASDIVARGDRAGTLEVYYLEERSEGDEGPFLKEERSLLNTIAERLGKITERKQAEEELDRHRLHLEELVEERTAELKTTNTQLREEIAERKRIQGKLALYRQIIANSSEAIAIVDPQGQYLEQNAAHRSLLGYPDEELRGQTPAIHLGDEAFSAVIREQARKGTYRGELTSRTRSGASVDIDLSAFAVRDETGQPVCYVGIKRDITGRKQAEEALRESEHKYRHLFENLNDAAFVADAETGIILDTNKRAEELLGRSRGEIVGMHQAELHPPGEAEKYRRLFVNHVGKGYVADIDAQVAKKGGAAVPVSISAAATSIGGRRIILGLFRDITERKQAEEALKESEERFRSLVETTSDWVWEVDENAVYTYASPKIRDILGYEPEEVLGRTPFDFMPPEEARRVAEVFSPVAASPRPFASLENKNLHRDGHLVVLESSGVPFFDAHGTFRGWRGIDRDITERKQAEEAVQRSERELRVIAENIPALLSYVDKAGRYRFVNRRYQEWFGRPEADIVGRHYREILGEATYELIKDRIEAALSGQHVSYERAIPYAAGGTRWVIANYVPDTDERGRVRGFFALVTDITERKRAEEALRRMSKVFMNATDPIIIEDLEGRIVDLNAETERAYGWVRQELLGQPVKVLVPLERHEQADELLERCRRGEVVRNVEGVRWNKAGERSPVLLTLALLNDEAGQPVAVATIAKDIAKLKRAHEETELARQRIEELARREKQRANWLATILDQLPIGVCIAMAPDVKVILSNKKAAEIAGMPVQPGASWSEHCRHWRFQYPDGRPLPAEEVALARAVLRGEHVIGAEHVVERPDGTRLNLRGNAIPLLENGQVVGGVVAFWDVTAERETQRGLEEASRLKDEFLSMASHELRTPVTSIKIFAELAARRPEAVQPKFMATLLRQADQLVSLVNDLLDVSRLQLGRMPAEMKVLDLASLVREFCTRSRPLFGQRLLCRSQDEAILVEGDAMRLEQVFSNLLDNAVKYSPEGGQVSLRVSRLGDKALIEVTDQGIGIEPEALPHIFERFYKPASQQSVYSGLGVGLYICKEIVERHGGRIWAESEPGKGSTFYLELPLAEEAAPSQ
jgi:PAS domain S-box-containing protein